MSVSERSAQKIRRTFLDYFVSNSHEEVASSSLVPHGDPTLLFANAGMNQFKDVFTGKTQRARRRATSAQKCVRAGGKHNDLDNVGRTARHHTFFEMLGNFSFGDYFKQEAISFAYQLLARDYAIDPRRLVYTVHESDGEARTLWRQIAGVSDDKIISLGDKENFWAMGDVGPCGPCSEIHYHLGDDIPCAEEAAGRSCLGPACDCDRWLEIWNLVFMQFEQLPDKTRRPLPRPSVDTGMGLERLGVVLAGVRSTYETDLLRPLIAEVEAASGKTFVPADYSDNSVSVSMRAIADHARATAFLVADGVFPDKNGREYVLRRIMRRGIYHGWLLGIKKPFLASMAGRVIEEMGDFYGELRERRGVILEVAEQEERRFRDTLDRGLKILDEETGKLSGKQIPGELAFRLYDTYGFPVDLTRVIGEGRGLTVDEAGFDAKMDEQRRRGEFVNTAEVAPDVIFQKIAERVGPTRFLGYEGTDGRSEIIALVANGDEVGEAHAGGGPVAVVVRETPFYGEQGGQVGDTGVIKGPHGTLEVTDTRRPVGTLYVHTGKLTAGSLKTGETLELHVDGERRDRIRRNHSATHLLHWALRTKLGDHVAQKGSLVAPERLRFDFAHFQPLTPAEKRDVEDLVNARVLANVGAVTEVLPIADAKKAGAIAFFGEKYGDSVRVLTMGESKEFCGGIHVHRTGDIGLFKITEESGVAQGVRRIEAVTGEGAVTYVRRLEDELGHAAQALRSGPLEVAARVDKQQNELRERDKEIARLRAQIASGGGAADTSKQAEQVGNTWVLVRDVGVADPKVLRDAADKLRVKLDPGVLVLVGAAEGKVAVVSAVTPGAQERFDAGAIIKLLGGPLGWKGGGRKDLAQGGGPLPEGKALAAVLEGWRQQIHEHVASRA